MGLRFLRRLGTNKKPIILRVQSQKRAEELVVICSDHRWQFIIGIEPDKPENIEDLEKMIRRCDNTSQTPAARYRPVSGNDYCPCGSGMKFKKCCGQKSMV
ncbi:MAG: hypothetical protein COX46_03555 [bacterium (Candidatus Ratteibacteria) CG23_combo_of_CG06-09_8_20_14_all_48_7]|uniref:Zinc chelation protein SecC n=1 Tax=bacterium (Candidatus Ratteibacteria) CG23_combo_of_CG06-09_8_20_14_all_48_7 TaxID=2014292 RepID=A0A2G9YAH3_9BACT|nr:MAG: hypothetical protein COX46_03555 [bacterium (Candidatus Ratteibacteria) CG23_combo_of_CG06-09_8_20_14_all_48_7]